MVRMGWLGSIVYLPSGVSLLGFSLLALCGLLKNLPGRVACMTGSPDHPSGPTTVRLTDSSSILFVSSGAPPGSEAHAA